MLCPSGPGAPRFRATSANARLRFSSLATSSIVIAGRVTSGVFSTSAPHTGQRVRVGPSLRRERPLAGCRLSRETDSVGLPVHWPWSPSLPARGARLRPPFDGLPVLRDHPTPLVSSPSRLSFLDDYRLHGGSREVSSGKNTELRTDAVAYTPACPTDMGFAAVGQLTRRLGRLRGASLSLGSVLHP